MTNETIPLRPLGKYIIFRFHDPHVIKGGKLMFQEQYKSGLILATFDMSLNQARWGTVLAKGNEVSDDIKVGDKVLIDALKWTNGVEYNTVMYWRTSEEHIIGIDDETT